MTYIMIDSPYAEQFTERYPTEERVHSFVLSEPKLDNWRDAAIDASNINMIYTMPKHPNNEWKVIECEAILKKRGYDIIEVIYDEEAD